MIKKSIKYNRSSQEKKQKIVEFFNLISSFSHYKRKAFLLLLRWSYRYALVDGNQETMAREVGVTRKTINLWMKEFERSGLLHKKYRHMTSCIYRVDELFYNWYFRRKISQTFQQKLLGVLFSVSSLMSLFSYPSNSLQSEYVSHITPFYFDILKSSLRVRAPETKLDRLKDDDGDDGKKSLKRKSNMLPFTDEENEKLREFPKNVIDYAHKKMTNEILSGKEIYNQFNYFVAICRNYKEPHSPSHVLRRNETKPLKREGQRLSQDVNQWQQKSQEQESYEFRERMYNIRKKLYDRGFKWQGETYGEMGLILKGYLPGRPREPHDPPPFL